MGISPQRILSFNHGGVYRRPWHERARKRAPASRQAPVRDVRRRAGFYTSSTPDARRRCNFSRKEGGARDAATKPHEA